jgi:magnesium chelatase accessory protein
MTTPPDWRTDGVNWPNRAHSQFVTAAGLRWHVQVAGEGPPLLLLHGTGAATHSWAGLLPLLAPHFRVVAPDLPGHGFTQTLPAAQMSLPGMGGAIAELLATLDVRPAFVAGHSAGAAILARMCLDRLIDPAILFGLNGAFLPLDRMPMTLFSPLARWLAANPLVPRVFAFHAADRRVVDRLLRNTGSSVPPDTAEFYSRLVRRSGHAAGALAMMAHWDLATLKRDLPGLTVPLVMINGGNDRIIPPSEARAVRCLLPTAQLIDLPGLGHLAHEEAAAQVAEIMIAQAAQQSLAA